MMARLIVTAIVLAASPFGTAFAKSADPLQGLAKHMVRSIDFDLCLPADAIEYEALGKHAVIQLVTSTAIAAELPLKSVYVDVRGLNVTLRRIWRSGVAPNGDRYEHVSFYVIQIRFTNQQGHLLAGFKGALRGDRESVG